MITNNNLTKSSINFSDVIIGLIFSLGVFTCYLRGNDLHLRIMILSNDNNIANNSVAFTLLQKFAPKNAFYTFNAQVSTRYGQRYPAIALFNTDGTVVVSWQGGLTGSAGEFIVDVVYPLEM